MTAISTIETLQPTPVSGPAPAAAPELGGEPTVWGLSILQLHDRFWAARGVQVVRLGEPSTIVDDAELFLLTDPRTLVMLRIREVVEKMVWMKPDLLIVRLRNMREEQYRETAICDENGSFVRYQRSYGGWDARLARVGFTRDQDLARSWQNATDVRAIWKQFRRQIRPEDRVTVSLTGRVYDRSAGAEAAQFMRDLVRQWKRPDTTVPGIREFSPGVWAMTAGGASGSKVETGTDFIGPVWIGAGRHVGKEGGGSGVIGPAALWDDPACRPEHEELEWQDIEPRDVLARPAEIARTSGFYETSKRLFDIACASAGLLLTLPIYPVIFAATWLEDGQPFFYGQRRETRGGREFSCWKFRSMRKDADAIKARLQAQNQADGPQFFMKQDPRLTRVGRILRKYNIDELPQLWNVLTGDMSLVGPRPSPRKENQFCPPWREARLSVRPGLTGLWQVKRTRRRGLDFQEWIKFDLEYVKRAGWRLDLWILVETARVLIMGSRS
jgi:lipopolysaccharide/colanic/teichoic acid biosynthesis glycosyltransferase